MNKYRIAPFVFILLVGGVTAPAQTPEEVIAQFEERVNMVYRAEAGQPLVRSEKKPPLSPGRGKTATVAGRAMFRAERSNGSVSSTIRGTTKGLVLQAAIMTLPPKNSRNRVYLRISFDHAVAMARPENTTLS